MQRQTLKPFPEEPNTDTVPAMLTPGEFVIRKDAVDAIGVDKLNLMNNIDRLSMLSSLMEYRPSGYQEGGEVRRITKTTSYKGPGARFMQSNIERGKKNLLFQEGLYSIPAEATGQGSGLRYYIGEAFSPSLSMLGTKANMDAMNKIMATPSDSLESQFLDEYFSKENIKKRRKQRKKEGIKDSGTLRQSRLEKIKDLLLEEVEGMQEGGEVMLKTNKENLPNPGLKALFDSGAQGKEALANMGYEQGGKVMGYGDGGAVMNYYGGGMVKKYQEGGKVISDTLDVFGDKSSAADSLNALISLRQNASSGSILNEIKDLYDDFRPRRITFEGLATDPETGGLLRDADGNFTTIIKKPSEGFDIEDFDKSLYTPEGGLSKKGIATKLGIDPETVDIDTLSYTDPSNFFFRATGDAAQPTAGREFITDTIGSLGGLPALDDALRTLKLARQKQRNIAFEEEGGFTAEKRRKDVNTYLNAAFLKEAVNEMLKKRGFQQGGMVPGMIPPQEMPAPSLPPAGMMMQEGGMVEQPMPQGEMSDVDMSMMPDAERAFPSEPMEQMNLKPNEMMAYQEYGPESFRYMAPKFKPRAEFTPYDAMVDAGIVDPYETSEDDFVIMTRDMANNLRGMNGV